MQIKEDNQQLFSMAETRAVAVATVDAHKAKDLIQSGHRYLDVRNPEDFQKVHADVGNILNVPYYISTPEGRMKNPHFLDQVSYTCSKDDHLVVACFTGNRSVLATTDLHIAGFKNVSNIGGGLKAWMENGFDVKKPQEDEK